MSLARTIEELIELFGKTTIARGYADWATMISQLAKDGQTWRWHYDTALVKSSKEIEQSIINGRERARKANVEAIPAPFFLLPETLEFFRRREAEILAGVSSESENPERKRGRIPRTENHWMKKTEPGGSGV